KALGALELGHQETPSPLNPLGVKGAGEAGVIPVSALIASAVEDAVGYPIDSVPLSPSDLYALQQRAAAGELPSVTNARPPSTRTRATLPGATGAAPTEKSDSAPAPAAK